MKDRPIIMSEAEVRAVLAGRKTQLRRPVSARGRLGALCIPGNGVKTWSESGGVGTSGRWAGFEGNVQRFGWTDCPFGKVGDRLWVREVFNQVPNTAGCEKYGAGFDPTRSSASQHREGKVFDHNGWRYRATWDRSNSAPWRSPALMPRNASRLLLEVAAVRIERLQAIEHAEADAIAEGLTVVQDLPGAAFPSTYGWDGRQTNRTAWAAFGRVWKARYPDTDQILQRPSGPYAWERNPWVWVLTFRVAQVDAGLRDGPAYLSPADRKWLKEAQRG